MQLQAVNVAGKEVFIPEYYQRVDSLPEDPDNSIPYMTHSEYAMCSIILYSLQKNESLPQNKEQLILGIRKIMGNNQGIIKVDANADYAYTIVKTVKEVSGVQYTLTYQKFCDDLTINIQGQFYEREITGIRDNIVFELFQQKGVDGISDGLFHGWARDPYDESITQGALMNLSEHEIFDEKFPGFPLSMCRELVNTLIG